MPSVAFDRYYAFDELTALLHAFAADYPALVEVDSIGKSHEGRDIWLVTVTNKATGSHRDKPAFWCDGNIHASEVSASAAVLYILNDLTTRYGQDAQITRAVDSRAFYLVPRLGPDGAEWALQSPPRVIRSSTRPYPHEEEDPYGLERCDLDGDGRILSIRIKDSNGPWKVADEEPRLLKQREPGEVGGTYYRLLPEGLFHNFDGLTMRGRKIKEGLDMNRNFPSAWRLEGEQHGAGPFPTSEPEIHAAVTAICERPNICGAVTFHTFAGVHLRPPSRMPDDDLPPEDIWTYKKIGEVGTRMTGYPAISNFHEFKYHPKEVITGVFDDWMYEHRGVYSWTTEIWSPQRQAGITDYKYIDWFRDHPFEDDLKLLAWSDGELGGRGFVEWYPFTHSQLGEVELGGWDAFYAFRNPPLHLLEKEIAPFAEWVVWQALASPKLELREARIDKSGAGVWRIRVAAQNTGWLPTNVTKIALKNKLCRGVVGEISRDGAADGGRGSAEPDWLTSGKIRQEGDQLVGWDHVSTSGFGWHIDPTSDVAVFEWVVSSPGDYAVTIHHDRAGRVNVKLNCR
ncbi:MAG: M14 family metallopeptidase [Fimbriimonadaceae bacterium]